jgi:hypothetical protein
MKARLAAGAALLIILIGACWLWFSAEAPPARTELPQAAAAPKALALPPEAAASRVLLTDDQVQKALQDGTLDRPVKSLLKVRGPLQFGDYRWDDAGVPPGPTWIRVDLGKQLISVFRAGHEIGTSVIVYGGDNKQTPSGTLHVLAKARDHRSSLYDAEMPFTLRLTDDGVSIHGSTVASGKATHGCIGVPLAFAGRLFDATMVGEEVVIVPAAPRTPVS